MHGNPNYNGLSRARVIAATALGYAGFVAAAWVVSVGWTAGIDRAFVLGLRDASDVTNPVGPAWVEETAVDITALGGYPILVLLAVLVVAALLIWKRSAAALFVVVSLSGGAVISSGLKLIFLRPRPDVVEHLDRTFTHSFPSAHAMMSMVALLTFAAVASHGVANRAFRTFAFASAIVISLLIGGSRVYLGVHWPSDVIAGWALGVGWVGTISLVALALRDRVAPSIR